MSIDRGDSHYKDAGSWEKATRHIALFLWWAAERGLASDDHDAAAMAQGPTQYFIKMCDTKLWGEDLNDEGNRFAEKAYDDYLGEVEVYAAKLKTTDYEIPDTEGTRAHFFGWLDRRLARWRDGAKQ